MPVDDKSGTSRQDLERSHRWLLPKVVDRASMTFRRMGVVRLDVWLGEEGAPNEFESQRAQRQHDIDIINANTTLDQQAPGKATDANGERVFNLV